MNSHGLHSTADAVLKYISQILMEEEFEVEDQTYTLHDSALQAAEKSFYDVLAEKYSSSTSKSPPNQNPETQVSATHMTDNKTIEYTFPFSLHANSYPSRSVSGSTHRWADSSVSSNKGECVETWQFHQHGKQMILDFANNKVTPVAGAVDGEVFPALSNLDEEFRNSSSRILKQPRNCANSSGLSDLRSLLIHCAEALAGNDHISATEILMQIRHYSTPFGNGSQRLAHFFANALEARMSGNGSNAYATLAAKRIPSFSVLKAYKFLISATPFMNLSNFFATQIIAELAEKADRIHIIHFGLTYGVPWVSLIEYLSTRPGTPPLLRITGIEIGPEVRFEQMGRYLASYCKGCNVPLEYNMILQQLENIKIQDLKLDRDHEAIAVCSFYKFKYLLDDTLVLDSQRDDVLNLIKRINPDIFIHGINNGAYNAPFFISRFREALFYFSSVFDMLEANVQREDAERMVLEQEIFGKAILNVIACEGPDRVERPETYKQWQVRNVRAGLKQVPLKEEIMEKVKEQVKSSYHKDFFVVEDGQWMLQGWRGRILFAISCWKPA